MLTKHWFHWTIWHDLGDLGFFSLRPYYNFENSNKILNFVQTYFLLQYSELCNTIIDYLRHYGYDIPRFSSN